MDILHFFTFFMLGIGYFQYVRFGDVKKCSATRPIIITYLQSTIKQSRLNHLLILGKFKNQLDSIQLDSTYSKWHLHLLIKMRASYVNLEGSSFRFFLTLYLLGLCRMFLFHNFSWNSNLVVFIPIMQIKSVSKSYSLIAISFWTRSKYVFHFDLVTLRI